MKNISDILREERERKGLSIDDVVAATKIKKNFLVAIEQANFNALPSESYAMGFVKNYAHLLGIPEQKAAALFRREYEAKQIEIMPKFRKKKTLPGRGSLIRSPKGYLILAVLAVILVYVSFQFSFIFVGPKLSISSPKNGVVVSSNIVSVSGKTDPYATVTINKEEVYVDLSGAFKKTLYVYTGDDTIDVIAKNRSGRTTEKKIKISVK